MPGSRIENHRHFDVLLIAASCALSALAILRDPLVNDDGVLYLVLAREAAERGIGTAFALFDLPLYPVLIAAAHELGGLSLLGSAHLVDAVLLALLVLGFTRFASALCADQGLAPWVAALVLLFPQLNEYRGLVMRDFGFWALIVSALLPLLRYQATLRWADGMRWALLGAAAAAFRPEAFVYLALMPFACLQGDTRAARFMNVARLYACIGLLALPPLVVLARFDMLREPLDALLGTATALGRTIGGGFSSAVARYADTVLDPRSAGFAHASLTAGLLALLAMRFAAALGVLYCALLAWGIWTGRAALPAVARPTYRLLLATALLIAVSLVLGRQFVTGRDVMMLSLLALIPAALALRAASEHARVERREGLFRLVLGIAILWLGAQGFVSLGTRQDYRHQSIAWMRGNLPDGARVFSNDRVLAFHSGGRFAWEEVTEADTLIAARRAPLGVAYWILQRDRHDTALEVALGEYAPVLEPLAHFDGENGARIDVFRVTAGPAPR